MNKSHRAPSMDSNAGVGYSSAQTQRPPERGLMDWLLSLWLVSVAIALGFGMVSWARASEPAHAAPKPVAAAAAHAEAPPTPKSMGDQVREALESSALSNKTLTVVAPPAPKPKPRAKKPVVQEPITDEETGLSAAELDYLATAMRASGVVNPQASRQYIRAKAAAMTGRDLAPEPVMLAAADPHGADPAGGHEVHWSYSGEGGPEAWGKLKPEFNVCAIGKRQSPINIEEPATLRGPAEPIQFSYHPSDAVVSNNGHTIQVDVMGDNSITVRGNNYRLLQFHFHAPSEERVNYRGFAMVAHLVHKSADGQLAVVGVLLDPGEANALIDKVWTYMPLDPGDKVVMPLGALDLNELLPQDQRYFQYFGSLTTPPCSEGVLWMVMKQPTPIGKEQIRLFTQLYPNNARPVQPANGRAVRNAQ